VTPVQLADIEVAARVLLATDPVRHDTVLSEIIARADAAERYCKKAGRPHPSFGGGTVMSATASYPKTPRVSFLADADLRAIACVINGLLANSSYKNS
jgi:hypothetical protein